MAPNTEQSSLGFRPQNVAISAEAIPADHSGIGTRIAPRTTPNTARQVNPHQNDPESRPRLKSAPDRPVEALGRQLCAFLLEVDCWFRRGASQSPERRLSGNWLRNGRSVHGFGRTPVPQAGFGDPQNLAPVVSMFVLMCALNGHAGASQSSEMDENRWSSASQFGGARFRGPERMLPTGPCVSPDQVGTVNFGSTASSSAKLAPRLARLRALRSRIRASLAGLRGRCPDSCARPSEGKLQS